jgi:hypothetical protein
MAGLHQWGLRAERGEAVTIDDIKLSNQQHGYHFFSADTLRFFSSRIGQDAYEGPGGVYFTTSEQFRPSGGAPFRRRYTVRRFDPATGRVKTVGDHQQYASSSAARMAAARCARDGGQLSAGLA